MSRIEEHDVSDKPRSITDLFEAKTAVETVIVKHFLAVPLTLAIHLTTIREALTELIILREEKGGNQA